MSFIRIVESAAADVLALRTRYRQSAQCQIVHDSIHRRAGWTRSYRILVNEVAAGFGSVAVGGPWTGKPTIFEFYLLPEFEIGAFVCFERFLAACDAQFFEVQTSDTLLTVMLHAFGRKVISEKIVFRDGAATGLVCAGVSLRPQQSPETVSSCLNERQGGGEWTLERDGSVLGKGGILFHYNRPYADVYMEIAAPYRRQGLGSFLVQELKRICYELGAVPGARCNPDNLASRQTLQRAGFVPFAHILDGELTGT